MRLQEGKRLFALFFMLGFMLGILFSNLVSADYLQNVGIFHDYFLSQYTVDQIRTRDYFWYVLGIRSVPVAVLMVFAATKLKRVAGFLFLVWTGFGMGMIFTTAIMKMGVLGIVLCLMAAVPHFLLYFAGYFILLWQMFQTTKTGLDFQRVTIVLLLFSAGIILECLVNPVIMELVIQNLIS